MITEEMVTKALAAYWLSPRTYEGRDNIRAALEAIEPMLIAQWLRQESSKYIVELGMIFHARANELDPQ